MNEYVYGAYGHAKQSIIKSTAHSSTALVLIGTAPVNLVRGYASKDLVNVPVKLKDMGDVKAKMGMSKHWEQFTLCEAFKAHFDNPLGNIGPIYVINVLDPAVHKTAAEKNQELTFVNGRASILSDTIILDTFALADKVEGVDYILDYDFDRGAAIISSAGTPLTGSIAATYSEIDPTDVTKDDIIGGKTAGGVYTGIGSVPLVWQELSVVPNLISAPGWSHIPEVYKAMTAQTKKINGHWFAYALADIPLVSGVIGEETPVDTIEAAIKWAEDNGYNLAGTDVAWPMGQDSDGDVYHLSTIYGMEAMYVDAQHKGVPMETPANKPVPLVRQYFGPNSKNRGFDQQDANRLTASGITTIIPWEGLWTLWGDHTAAYKHGEKNDPLNIFDVNYRMMCHILNSFQRRWASTIDKPMTIGQKDAIINKEQEYLDGLVAIGALIGKPVVNFLASENSAENMLEGRFQWDTQFTNTPPLKGAILGAAWTDEGYSALLDEGGAE